MSDDIQVTAQDVTRDGTSVRVELTVAGAIPVVGPFGIPFREPVEAQAGDVVQIIMKWPGATEPVIQADPVTMRSAGTLNRTFGRAYGIKFGDV